MALVIFTNQSWLRAQSFATFHQQCKGTNVLQLEEASVTAPLPHMMQPCPNGTGASALESWTEFGSQIQFHHTRRNSFLGRHKNEWNTE